MKNELSINDEEIVLIISSLVNSVLTMVGAMNNYELLQKMKNSPAIPEGFDIEQTYSELYQLLLKVIHLMCGDDPEAEKYFIENVNLIITKLKDQHTDTQISDQTKAMLDSFASMGFGTKDDPIH